MNVGDGCGEEVNKLIKAVVEIEVSEGGREMVDWSIEILSEV